MHEFIEIAKKSADLEFEINDRYLFWTLVNNMNSDGSSELSYIKKHPEVLTVKLHSHLVFDIFYEKVINNKYHPKDSTNWELVLSTAIKLVNTISDSDLIKHDKKYITRLQATNHNLTDLFDLLLTEDFAMGDPEFLVYSIIARGEIRKLEILSSLYVIEDYNAVLDVALRFGRSSILKYFKNTLNLEFEMYGKILNFENYKENPRYLYYREHIAQDDSVKQKPIVGAAKQNYKEAIQLVLDVYHYDITIYTIKKWCDLIRDKEFLWDKVNPQEILPLLLSHCVDNIPLTTDFGEFNHIIFGHEWSNRECLVQRCLNLQDQLEQSNIRSDTIESKYRHLQSKYDQIIQYIHDRNHMGRRLRRDTH